MFFSGEGCQLCAFFLPFVWSDDWVDVLEFRCRTERVGGEWLGRVKKRMISRVVRNRARKLGLTST